MAIGKDMHIMYAACRYSLITFHLSIGQIVIVCRWYLARVNMLTCFFSTNGTNTLLAMMIQMFALRKNRFTRHSSMAVI